MRKNLILAVILGLFVAAFSAQAFAYTINDYIDNPTNWKLGQDDRIGDVYFEIYGIDIAKSSTNLTFSLFTSYPDPTKTKVNVGSWETFPGDLMFSVSNGIQTIDYGVALSNHPTPNGHTPVPQLTKGGLYLDPTWKTSDYWAAYHGTTGYIYHEGMPTTIDTFASLVSTNTVTWTNLGLLDGFTNRYKYRIDIPLDINTLLPSGYDISYVYWASATCANDYVATPEPASLALLGLGLLGIVGLKRRTQNVKRKA